MSDAGGDAAPRSGRRGRLKIVDYDDLPYSPHVRRLLGPLRAGFRVFNRFATPVLRSGGGVVMSTPFAGSMLVLHTTGHKSGLPRDAPLGYVIIDGRVVLVAGYGRATHWFRNALAHPEVQVTLPGAVLAGHAEEVTDPVQRKAALIAHLHAEGMVARSLLGESLDDSEALDRLAESLPVLAITPTAVLPGPFDPGGIGTKLSVAVQAVIGAALVGAVVGALRGRRAPRG